MVGIEHGTAPVGRKSISVQIHDIDIGTALCDPFLDDAGTLVDERVDAALHDLMVAHLARREAFLRAVFLDDRAHLRVRDGVAGSRIVAIPAPIGLLAEAARLA